VSDIILEFGQPVQVVLPTMQPSSIVFPIAQGVKGDQGIQGNTGAQGSGVKITPWTAGAYLLGDQVNYLGKDWASNAATVAGDVPGTSTKWIERLTNYVENFELLNKADLLPGKNIYNLNKATSGFYISNTNGKTADVNYFFSDFIPVTVGASYKSNKNMRFTCYYDINRMYVSGGNSASGTTFTVPPGVAYVIFSGVVADNVNYQLELGTVSTTYATYTLTIPLANIDPSLLVKNDIVNNLSDLQNTKPLSSFMGRVLNETKAGLVVGKNKFNKLTATSGKLITDLNVISTDVNWGMSYYIPVLPNTQYVSPSAKQMRFTCYYDSNYVYVSGGNSASGNSFTTPSNAAFVIVSFLVSYLNTMQVEIGSSPTTYVDYSETILESQLGISATSVFKEMLLSESYIPQSITYTNDLINSPISVIWADGDSGVLTLTRDLNDLVTILVATKIHNGVTLTLTETITRDLNGTVTALTIT
jgi:hypothetical protein